MNTTAAEQSPFTLRRVDRAAIIECGRRRLRIVFCSPCSVRVTYTEGRDFRDRPSRIVTAGNTCVDFELREDDRAYVLSTSSLTVKVLRQSGALSYYGAGGKLLTREPDRGGKWLTPKKLFRNVYAQDAPVITASHVDGVRATASACEQVFDRDAFEAKLEFCFAQDEALFGLGSHEEGYGNLRGKSRELYQQNLKAAVPFLISTRGYGVLFDCCSLMTFHDDAHGSYWWADAVDELDYYVIAGGAVEGVMRGYYELTGTAPLPPKWAFGYIQSKERYVTAQEMIDVVREYRRRHIPLDAIVLDWKSWPNGQGWGQKSLDPVRFPDPEAFISKLHEMGARLMVSIWPIMTGSCPDQIELLRRNLMLGNGSTYNAFAPEARALYWKQAERGLFSKGVDAWWCDCTEPFESDWQGAVKPEPHLRLAKNTEEARRYLDAAEINAFSLLHSQGIYEGQRAVTGDKRVLNLTRSAYAGQHRYGTVTWNGDISATWETLRRCIPEGVNFCASGEPYWTVDIGGFFVGSDPSLWFWRGDFQDGCRGLTDMNALAPDPDDRGCRDRGYWELYTRWLQYGAFLPMFRSHGTDAAREIWRFGEEGTPFYDVIARYIRLRYELMPYIYSLAAAVTLHGSPMMRPVAWQFPGDLKTHGLLDQYLFGPSFLVCPVTSPMYFAPQSRPLEGVARTRSVYLPAGRHWFDFWTDALYEGGRQIEADAPLETMPLFVPEGSIIPMSEAVEFVDQRPDAPYEIRVYAGRDAQFAIYEDSGDGYEYESGAFALIRLFWSEMDRKLTIAKREGTFAGMTPSREYRMILISRHGRAARTITYAGEEVDIVF
ncbi:MAG TPA: glycoside hydrolase family 31 protein [Terracidiphilus sp.]|nr:glycoside hydrolase family 31 protein [Terracidiphilus sp.]